MGQGSNIIEKEALEMMNVVQDGDIMLFRFNV